MARLIAAAQMEVASTGTRTLMGVMHTYRLAIIGFLLLVSASGQTAVQRSFQLVVPDGVRAGTEIEVRVKVVTEAGAGEQIGFLHVEASRDGGKQWIPVAYEQNLGAAFERSWRVAAGPAGAWTLFRARAAFRGGVAGDVDYRGAAIRWHDTWAGWQEPPAVHGATEVR